MESETNKIKPNFELNLKNVQKSDSRDTKTSKESNRYEPSNVLIKNYLATSGVKLKNHNELVKEKMTLYRKSIGYKKKLRETEQRQWLSAHKRTKFDFTDKEINQLKKYFNSLDDDGSGEIDIQELENPLISLGIAESREDVIKIIESVTEEGEREINFTDFLSIINSSKNNEHSVLIEFFKDMIDGKLAGGSIPKSISFNLIIDTIRRKKLLDASMSDDYIKKANGLRVLEAFEKRPDFFQKFKKKASEEEYENATK